MEAGKGVHKHIVGGRGERQRLGERVNDREGRVSDWEGKSVTGAENQWLEERVIGWGRESFAGAQVRPVSGSNMRLWQQHAPVAATCACGRNMRLWQ
eukprot:352151-Chlamydomonas_euryale.AAC.1